MWCLSPGQLLTRRGWDGEYLVYNDLSGDTHLLGELAVELLLALRQGAQDESALAAELELPADPEQYAVLHDLLAELAGLSLIDTVAC
jgi:PqqD family protein of HPr-rel-A system